MASLTIAGVAGTGHLAVAKTLYSTKIERATFFGTNAVRLDLNSGVVKNIFHRKSLSFVCSAAPAASADVSTLPKSSVDGDSSNGTPVEVSNISEFIETGSMKRLKALYDEEIIPALMKEFEYTNKLQVPKLEKIVVNCGVGDASQNAKALDGAKKDLSIATGQQPVVTRAKKAIAGFKVRENMVVGLATTLRGQLMYSFIDRLVNLVLPRMRDFGGLNKGSFDGRGNFTLGLKEQTLFPEIPYDQIDRTRGMDITIVTNAKSDREGKRLLELMGLKFKEQTVAPVVVKKSKKRNYRR